MHGKPYVLILAIVAVVAVSFAPLLSQTNQQQTEAEGSPTEKQASEDNTPSPTQLLRNATDYLGDLQAVSCRLTMKYHIQSKNLNQEMSTTTSIRMQRPNRLAAVLEEGMMGVSVICDGEKVFRYMPPLNRYTVEDAPQELSELETAERMMMGGLGGMLGPTALLGGEALYDQLMEGVTGSEYIDQEVVDELRCHHCRFLQEDVNWELWVEVGEQPRIRKIVPDLAQQLARAGGQFQEMFKDAEMEFSLTLTDWDTNPQFTDADFAFTPPEGAEKVDSLFGGLAGHDEGPHQLLGEEAPAFTTVDLEENKVDLQDHLGQDIVILDFWATWCGPCVKAMPEIKKVANAFADRGVVLYAVNVREEADIIREFLDAKDLEVPVALDLDGSISDLYKAEAIPQTVIIGKDLRVQVVHVGFSSALEDQLTKDLESLLAGEDLATAALEEAAERQAQQPEEDQAAPENEGVEIVWSAQGRWDGVAVDRSSRQIYTVGSRGNAAVFNSAGTIQHEFQLKQGGNVLRSANLIGGDPIELIAFRGWGHDVRAYAADGSELWTYSLGQGVDDVWAADINNDGLDEVIIGYNGSTGLHVLDNQGTPLWKYTGIGNVWHVCVGNFGAGGETKVLTTSAAGQLHVFDADGNSSGDYDVSIYANMVRTAQLHGPDKPCLAILGGSADDGEKLVAVDEGGNERWSVDLPGSSHIDSLAVADDMPWAAVGMRGGLIYVVDLDQARVVGQVTGQGLRPEVGWIAREGASPLLLVATGKELQAIQITADESDEKG